MLESNDLLLSVREGGLVVCDLFREDALIVARVANLLVHGFKLLLHLESVNLIVFKLVFHRRNITLMLQLDFLINIMQLLGILFLCF